MMAHDEGIFRPVKGADALQLTTAGRIIGKQGRSLIILCDAMREIERLGGAAAVVAATALKASKET